MTIDIKKMKSVLEAKRAELQKSLEKLTEAYLLSIEAGRASRETQDWGEAAVDINEMEGEWSIRTNQEALLIEVEEALKRIDKGTYGVCVQCKQPIPEKRLQILPWAARDIRCQEQLEARKSEVPEEPVAWMDAWSLCL